MVQALGGDQWLNAQNSYVEGRIAGFYQGKPTGATVRYWDWRTPDDERIDLTEGKTDKHNWTQIFDRQELLGNHLPRQEAYSERAVR